MFTDLYEGQQNSLLLGKIINIVGPKISKNGTQYMFILLRDLNNNEISLNIFDKCEEYK